jgi:hypothetical protein
MQGTTEPADFVEDLLTDGAASVVYGPSNCGKSFWILDLAACVATGRPFRGELEVDRGTVVYVALEGSHGARNRIEALKRGGLLPKNSPLFLCFAPVSLLTAGHAERLAETVRRAAALSVMPCRLVILDTLARAMAGGDENKGQDMTAAVAAIDRIREATGAHVCVVHHCGKNEALGARGHSSLRAAVDTEIEISRSDGLSVASVTKQRDLTARDAMPFHLGQVGLGIGRRGKPITSCVVEHDAGCAAENRRGRPPKTTASDLLNLLPQPSTTAWQKTAKEELRVSATAFFRQRKELKQRGRAVSTQNGGWERGPWKIEV